MSLIAILIALFIEHFLGSLEELRRFDWFGRFADALNERLPQTLPWRGTFSVLLTVGLPVFAVALAAHLLAELWVVLGFLFGIAVLLYSLGPRDLEADVEAYADALDRADTESAQWHAASLLNGQGPEGRDRSQAILETVFVEANERLLGVIFWFLVLGPLGALLYRLSREMRLQPESSGELADASFRLHYILNWVPARLCALSFALVGSFVDAMHRWRADADTWPDENRGVLVAAGLGAQRYAPAEGDEADPAAEALHVRESMALVRRAVVVWLAVLAVLTLAGWSH